VLETVTFSGDSKVPLELMESFLLSFRFIRVVILPVRLYSLRRFLLRIDCFLSSASWCS